MNNEIFSKLIKTYNSDGCAEVLNGAVKQSSGSKLLLIIFAVVQIVLQTMIIFNIELSEIFIWNTNFQSLTSIISEDSMFNRLSVQFNVLRVLREMDEYHMGVFLVMLTAFIWLIIISVIRHDLIKMIFDYEIFETRSSIYGKS
jgi:hypothetical protein